MVLSDNRVKWSHPALRIIPFECFSGIQNMSLDYYYSRLVEETNIPILRFYGWQPFCLSLGHHQTTTIIDRNMVDRKEIDIVRRPTGGSAIYHANELTYSFILPKSIMSHQQMYYMFHYILSAALNDLGLNVTLSNRQTESRILP